jgi:O-antigen ligase
VFWVAWVGAFLVVASFNRGGLLSIVAAMAVVVAFGRRAVRGRVVRAGAVALSLGAGLLVLDAAGLVPAISPPGERRALSVGQLAQNLASVVGGGGKKDELEGSRAWRLEWWGRIVRYTVHGPYFWTGKGFGVNLATDDGFQVDAEEHLRSPHNGHLSILARSGVPGLALWALLQAAVAGQLVWAHLQARRRGDEGPARLTHWLLAYWAASVVDLTFDVYLEGPQGGIWFWSTVGAAVAAAEEQRRRAAAWWRPGAGR